jgi:surfeit locus 1 family protein
MRVYFRPLPGLTIASLISLAVLLSLGTWQYHRLQWKTALLEEVEVAANAPALTSIRDLQAAMENGEPVDFRRIEISVARDADAPVFHVYTSGARVPMWRPFTHVTERGTQFFAGLAPFEDSEKDAFALEPADTLHLQGHVRIPRKLGWMTPKSTPERNRWFGFNPMPETFDWADRVSGYAETDFYVEVSSLDVDGQIPVRKPDIRNNHFDYMLTWYGLALTLIIIYLIFHRRQGRLGLK